MTEALAVIAPLSLKDKIVVADTMAKSGLFPDCKEAAKAFVKIQYGEELNIGPAQAMMQIYVVDGKPGPAATLLAAKIKQSGRYDYKIVSHDEKGCTIDFFERAKISLANMAPKWEKLGTSTFNLEDAQRAGLIRKDNFQRYPRNMTFARAMSNGARWYCPDVFGGSVYTYEELQEESDLKADAKVVAGETAAESRGEQTKRRMRAQLASRDTAALPPATEAPVTEAPAAEAAPAPTDAVVDPTPAPVEEAAPAEAPAVTDDQLRENINNVMRSLGYKKARAHALFSSIAEHEVTDIAELTREQLEAVITYLAP